MTNSAKMPGIVAHRGFSLRYIENSRAAFAAALSLGVDAVELDVQLTADGVPVVFHDHDFTRFGYDVDTIEKLNYDAIRRLALRLHDRPGEEPVPTLGEVFDLFPENVRLLIEIKTWMDPAENTGHYEKLLNTISGLIHNRRVKTDAVLLCYSPEVLLLAKEIAPELPRALNADFLPEPLDSLQEMGLAALSLHHSAVVPGLGDRLRQMGLALYVFTADTKADLLTAAAAGPDLIMSDDPEWLGTAIKDLG